ncbi:MAG TPA: dual specificity protein phosphatase family protein [Ktedonobacterales bacterium]|jgi:protein-tyrosine phosphatase|nr:dual specificity protein phosphatase family protein [Ktedonobacterales bacterium]
MRGFYWLIEDALAGCARPGGSGARRTGALETEGELAALDADLAWLREQGIGAVLSLTETPLDAAALERYELESLHVPIDDMTAPVPEQFDSALRFIDWQRVRGQRVVVHCKMGQGRTGVILAAYLVRLGVTPAQALARVRAVCPGAVENREQEHALDAFASRRDWII